jgi:acetyl esterase/lipase
VPRGIIANRMQLIADDYMRGGASGDLLDPLCLIESALAPERPLPHFLLSAGTRDPILDDTQRLEAALLRRAVPHQAHYYEGELHAFQGMLFRRAARDYWRRSERFLGTIFSS